MFVKYMFAVMMAVGLTAPLAATQPKQQNHKGTTYLLEKRRVNTLELKKSISNQAAKNKIDTTANCPPPPPLATFNNPVTQNPNAIAAAFYPDPAASNALAPPPQAVGVTFIAGKTGQDPTSDLQPPDTCLAVGKSQVVLGDNMGIKAYDKMGNHQDVADAAINTLLNYDGNFTTFLTNFDARIRFFDGRFYIISSNADYYGDFLNLGFAIAVSDSDELSDTTAWTVFTVFNAAVIPDSNGCPGDQNTEIDFPNLAIDDNAAYLSYSIYSSNGGSLTTSLFVFQKESLLGDGPVVATAFRDVVGYIGDQSPIRGEFVLQPAMNFDKKPEFGYVVLNNPTMFGSLSFFRVIDPGSTSPSLSPMISIDVLTTGCAIANPALYPNFPENLYGDFGRIEYVDDRLQMAHVIDGQLYTTHAIVTDANGVGDPNGDRLSSRWYQINMRGAKKHKEHATTKPILVQAGTLFDPSPTDPLFYNFPSIMTNKRGDLTLCGTVSGNNQSLSAFYVGRLKSDPLGTLRIGATPPSVYFAGSGAYTFGLESITGITTTGFTFGQRWGDLSYTALDPEDKMTMWTIQEVSVDNAQTQVVAELKAP